MPKGTLGGGNRIGRRRDVSGRFHWLPTHDPAMKRCQQVRQAPRGLAARARGLVQWRSVAPAQPRVGYSPGAGARGLPGRKRFGAFPILSEQPVLTLATWRGPMWHTSDLGQRTCVLTSSILRLNADRRGPLWQESPQSPEHDVLSDGDESDVYHPTTRVLTVLELLQARGRLSGPEIAERLEVDLRTVRRYVTMLQDLGIPVEAERGRNGGYHLRKGSACRPCSSRMTKRWRSCSACWRRAAWA